MLKRKEEKELYIQVIRKLIDNYPEFKKTLDKIDIFIKISIATTITLTLIVAVVIWLVLI